MKQLLVRGLDDGLVRRLKTRAREHGISAEEEHRRILREVLLREAAEHPSLIEYLVSDSAKVHPDTELDLSRSSEGPRSGTAV